ncbi:MAG: polymerase sigma-70 factor [Sphingobacterium sp.]|jgi:RNA polymerase sigma-70 factor (ECF subfamily)|uniref:RNA polymerase sigma factor n=1 Tax=Sphingobacterium sp. CZ-UAM TaxID=1933868 RepID=UPI000985385E|nr:sigma-70 family RNA polymerase sigma factor [Sphingobacterium sp. CZ-UAM]MDF2516550.1 polymerase sigma-70 factor [Sphingobacterium sp.]OOG16625.1 RNA polymerase sigma-70 factor [Sphingobacterium sp. CZ-UAM]
MKNSKSYQYQELLPLIQQGDQRAFSVLYDLFAPDLISFITKKISNREAAEDTLHDLFISVWKNRAFITEIESLPAYLFSSCRYLVLAYYRKEMKIQLTQSFEHLEFEDQSIPIEDQLYYRYIIDVVAKEVENLPQKCQEVFKLSREYYLSNKEIAIKLGISESTVEKHINKAIRHLRTATGHLFHFVLFF